MESRSKYSPNAEARAAFLVAPFPLVKHCGQSLSRICTDQTLGTGFSQDTSSILKPSAVSFFAEIY